MPFRAEEKMKIYNKGLDFTCECGITAEADVASDFHCISFNGNQSYYVICPNCGTKIEISEEEIPVLIKPHIHKKNIGLGHAD